MAERVATWLTRQRCRAGAPLRVAASACVLVLYACLEQPKREEGQWPIALSEIRAAAPSDPGEGAYRKTCIACHGADGKGVAAGQAAAGQAAAGQAGKLGADFTSPTGPLTKQDELLLTSIRDGVTGSIGVMPPHRTLLTEAEVVEVLAYVRRTFGAGITPIAVAAEASDAGVAGTTGTPSGEH